MAKPDYNHSSNSTSINSFSSSIGSKTLSHLRADSEFEAVGDSEPNLDDISDIQPKKGPFQKIKQFLGSNRGWMQKALLALFALGFLGLLGVGVFVVAEYSRIPAIEEIATPPVEGSRVFDRNNKFMFKYFDSGEKRELVDIKDIPESMQLAIIALEDENYYDNPIGIPWWNMAGAGFKCFVLRSDCRGGSGLSQQLMKNITKDDEVSLNRKTRELLTAIKFNQEVNKQDVLRLYLNWVPFGRNTYGVQEASKSYFRHGIGEKDEKGNYKLTIPEACYLASMVQRPSTFAFAVRDRINKKPNPNFEILEKRKNSCIDKLHTQELRGKGKGAFIKTQAEADRLQQAKVEFFPNTQTEDPKFGHIREFISNELEQKLNIDEKSLATQGYDIYTTFDVEMQDKVEKIIKDSANSRIIPSGANNASALVLDGPKGEIMAMVGSRDFNNDEIGGQVNMVTSPRQPGSSFKPYVYAGNFEKGFNPGTILADVRTTFNVNGTSYRPRNFSGTTYGLVSMRYSLQNSLNIPSIKALYLMQNPSDTPDGSSGLNNLLEFSERVGVKFPYRKNCSVSTPLGSCEISMLSHTTGINTLLQEGNLRTATPFKKVMLKQRDIINGTTTSRDVYAEAQKSSTPPYPNRTGVIEPAIAKQIANVMSDYSARDPGVWGQGARTLELAGWSGANSVAAKTGTTSDVKDVWTVGGTPYYTVSTWMGNTDNRPMNSNVSASISVAPIWNEIMATIHQNKTPKGFTTDGLRRVQLDPTGLPGGGGRSEFLTQSQISVLEDAKAKLSKNTYNPLNQSIFENRTAVLNRKVKVNPVDKKLLDESLNLPKELVEEVNCRQVISEFPQDKSWLEPAQSLGNQVCPTEKSTLKLDDIKPKIETNLKSNESALYPVTVTGSTPNPKGKIQKITLSIDGKEVATVENNSTLAYTPEIGSEEGSFTVEMTVTDNIGLSTSKTLENVTFQPVGGSSSSAGSATPITEADVAALTVACAPVTVGSPSDCTITVPEGKSLLPTMKIYIGNNQLGGNCLPNGLCSQVPTDTNQPGVVAIKISIPGSVNQALPTASTLTLN